MVKVKLEAPDVIGIECPGTGMSVTPAQAREIIVGLAQALDDGQHDIVHAFCASYQPDTISVSRHGSGERVKIQVEDRSERKREHVQLSKAETIRVALAMLSFAGEISGG